MNKEILFERNNYKGKQQIVKSYTTKGVEQFFWRRLAKNGNELSRSSETYDTLRGCLKGFAADSGNAQTWTGTITVGSIRAYKKSLEIK